MDLKDLLDRAGSVDPKVLDLKELDRFIEPDRIVLSLHTCTDHISHGVFIE